MKGYKGFDKDFKCNGNGNTSFQYKAGETYEHKGDVKLCDSGFHFVEHPLDAFGYYAPGCGSRYAEVEAAEVSDEKSSDTKRVCKRLTIKAELSLHMMIDAAIKFVFERVDWKNAAEKATGDQGAASATGVRGAASATGDQGAASATGDQGAASATGYQGAASATGYQGAASATGVEACAVALGIEGRAKGVKGSWLTIAQWREAQDGWHRTDVKTFCVDGKKIKADTWYKLRGGKLVSAKED